MKFCYWNPLLIKQIQIIIKKFLEIMESESDHWEPELMESQLLGHDPDEENEHI